MSNILIELFPALGMVFLGVLVIIFRESFARYNIEMRNKWFGSNFGEKDIKSSSLVFLLVGLVIIFLGAKRMISILS